MIVSLCLALAAGCQTSAKPAAAQPKSKDVNRVLVVINKSSEASQEIGRYYMKQRGIPGNQLVLITAPEKEQISVEEFRGQVEPLISIKLKAMPNIDYIVLTKGVPLRIQNGAGFSVDSMLASIREPLADADLVEPAKVMPKTKNPYYGKAEPFSAKKFGFYAVTRLDGYSVADAKALVDRSLAAKPEKGPFFLDAMAIKEGGYFEMNESLRKAGPKLKGKGYNVELDETPEYRAPGSALAGYATWGSNDGKFNLDTYRKITFKPGAICETFVSTSGRTFLPTTGGQSLIADLISQGVTGVKGYVSEPYTLALARPDILFDRYTSGYNLADSFYAASPLLKWKDIVIGDPLCSPYK